MSILLLFSLCSVAWGQNATVAIVVNEKDLIPEGLAYDPIDRTFYMGSINKKKILKIVPGRPPVDFIGSGQHELDEVLGIRIDSKKRLLWACSNTGTESVDRRSSVHVFDLTSGTILWKNELMVKGEAHLFNDLVLTSEGAAYVTDSDFKSIYKIAPDKNIERIITDDQLLYANGITLSSDERSLIISSFRGLFNFEIASKRLSRIRLAGYHVAGLDGLYRYGSSLVGIQNTTFPDAVNQYFLSEDGGSMTHANVLATNLPEFDGLTTGAIAEGWFYFIANSQLANYDNGKILDRQKLKDVVVMKVPLQ